MSVRKRYEADKADERKPRDPARHLGVYKSLDEVPERYRVRQHAAKYEGRDVWTEWVETAKAGSWESESSQNRLRLVQEKWNGLVADRGRHHALAQPSDVEAYAEEIADLSKQYAMATYWRPVEQLYRWLMMHTDHPHRYNPVWIAASQNESARKMWDHQITLNRDKS